jgi:hypothetical protein
VKDYGKDGKEGIIKAYHEGEWKGACDDGASLDSLA